MTDGAIEEALRPRWRGRAGRLEVWYTTVTDPRTGTGIWLHHELVAPAGGGQAFGHGWVAVFPPGGGATLARFGPEPWARRPSRDGAAFRTATTAMSPRRLRGQAGEMGWDLRVDGAVVSSAPLYTFPRWAWEREVLPGAQIVPQPTARFSGTVRHDGTDLVLAGAPGATAHIYGHGNARRWAWLHADLGNGDVLEVVAAAPMRRGLRWLPAVPFVQLRAGGSDWPARPLLAAARLRARIGLPTWTVQGRLGDRRLEISVTQPADATVTVDYADPDGTPAACHNSERADALVTVLRRAGGRWRTERQWRLDGIAHAEVGIR